jgi:hypothetical protein
MSILMGICRTSLAPTLPMAVLLSSSPTPHASKAVSHLCQCGPAYRVGRLGKQSLGIACFNLSPRKDGVASRSLSGIRCYLLVHSFQDERVGIFGQNRFLTKRPGPFLLSLLAMNGSSQGHFPHRKNVLSNRRFNKHRSGLGEASERPCRLLWCESVVLVQTTSEQRERAVTRGEDPVVGVRSQYP